MSNETLVEALRELFVKWLESRSPFRTTVEVEAAWEGWKANTAIAAMLAAEITEPVAWSCQDTINDDDGCPIGMDEPRVHWGLGVLTMTADGCPSTPARSQRRMRSGACGLKMKRVIGIPAAASCSSSPKARPMTTRWDSVASAAANSIK